MVAVPESFSPACFSAHENLTGFPTTSPSTFQVPEMSAAAATVTATVTATARMRASVEASRFTMRLL